MKISTKKLFLLDGIGALITALLLSQLLARFEEFFGMPKEILYPLATVAIAFSIYSITCSLALQKNFKKFLKIIIVANSLYCLVTLSFVIIKIEALTWFGIAYFIGEILVVSPLIFLEYQQMKQLKN